MSEKLRQEPVFPIVPVYNPGTEEMEYDYMYDERMGMSKRFYTACAAMQGMLSGNEINRTGKKSVESIVEKSYEYADELLKQENNEI